MSAVNTHHPMQQPFPPHRLMEQPTYSNNDFLLQQLQAQVEFYFCPQNLAIDKFLQDQLSQTEHLGAVPIQVICSFRKIRQLYSFAANIPVAVMPPADPMMLRMALANSSVVSVSHDGMWIIPNTNPQVTIEDDAKDTAATVETPPTVASTPSSPSSQATGASSVGNKDRNTIIIRDIPDDFTIKHIFQVFAAFSPKTARPDVGNTWYVTFEKGEDAMAALASDVVIAGAPIRGCLKSELGGQQQPLPPPAMPLPPPAVHAYHNMQPPPYPTAAFPQQPYGFMPMHHPYGMPIQQPYRMQPQFYPPQPYAQYYAGPPPPQQQRQTGGVPPQNVFVRPSPPPQHRTTHQNQHFSNNSHNKDNNSNNNNYNKRRNKNYKNNNRRNRQQQQQSSQPQQQKQQSRDQSSVVSSDSGRKHYNPKNNKNYDNREGKKQFKANRKKRHSPKAVDLSVENFPALGGGGSASVKQRQNITGPAYAQALLKKPLKSTTPSDPVELEKAITETKGKMVPAEEW